MNVFSRQLVPLVLLCFAFFTSNALAQLTAGTNTEAINIAIVRLEQRLNELAQVVGKITSTNQYAPYDTAVDKRNIDKEIEALAGNKEKLKKQINQATGSINTINLNIDRAKAILQSIGQYDIELSGIERDADNLVQLLKNPINQIRVSKKQRDKLPALLADIEKVDADLKEAKIKQQQLLNDQKSDLKAHTLWIKALTGVLSAKDDVGNRRLTTEESRLIGQIDGYQRQIKQLREKLHNDRQQLTLSAIQDNQDELFFNEQMAWLTKLDLNIINALYSNDNLLNADKNLLATLPENELEKRLRLAKSNAQLLKQSQTVLSRRFDRLQRRIEQLPPSYELANGFKERENLLKRQQLTLNDTQIKISKTLSKQRKQSLFKWKPLYADNAMINVVKKIPQSLRLIAYQVQISFKTLFQHVWEKPGSIIATALLLLVIPLSGIRLFRRYLNAKPQIKNSRLGLVTNARRLVFVLKKNYLVVFILLFIIVLVTISGTPYPGNQIVRIVTYLLLVNVVWFSLMTTACNKDGLPKGVARHSNLSVLLLTISATIYQLSQISGDNLPATSIYENIVFIAVCYFAYVIKKIMLYYWGNTVDKPITLRWRVTGLLMLTPPLAIMAGVAGLIGFNHAAWLVLHHTVIGFLFLFIVVLGLGTITDIRRFAKIQCIKRFEHGAFIAQDVISPIANILRLIWLFVATKTLFSLLGWDRENFFIGGFLDVVERPLFHFGESPINLFNIAMLLVAVYLIFKIGQWFKTFSYRWLYRKISDLGIRNSLSIFGQYFIILFGVIITMQVIGIDLTSLAVFAGALGVGVGLGLQDIAKNFISGILLLIERPLRSGDRVILDGSEGYIRSIGMRAIKLETFNKQEVIIPNSNAINNSFTNYTHGNAVSRTVLYIGAGYDCDPMKVETILRQVIEQTDGILKDPAPLVVMWEYADSAINYRLQYYLDLKHSSVLRTKTAVLEAIWYAFKENDIEIPFPQRDIHFRDDLKTKITSGE
ncbi:MAG: hypothetical protein CSA47_02095 [Gammaproteobacteria bacterium]|nr:MAG: hypothetical protein CSA47_02095 [Gammaproteobacteria bacterium]